MAQVDPAGLGRPRLATEQAAPEARDPLRVHAVDGHSRHEVADQLAIAAAAAAD
jgi:hypothetical protein